MNLVECNACKQEISPNATSCPHCGEPRIEAQKQTATGLLAALLIGLIIGSIIYMLITGGGR